MRIGPTRLVFTVSTSSLSSIRPGSLVRQHDAGVVDQHVEIGIVGDQPRRHGVDARRDR